MPVKEISKWLLVWNGVNWRESTMTQPMAVYVRPSFNDLSNLERNVLSAYLQMRLKKGGFRWLFRRRIGISHGWIWSTAPNGIFKWRDIFKTYPGEIIHWYNFLFIGALELNLLNCIVKRTYIPQELRADVAETCSHLIEGVRNLLNRS